MSNLTQLRLAAREIFDEAIHAVDARKAVQRAVKLEGSILTVCDAAIDLSQPRPIYAIAIGKAALAMTAALDGVLGEKLTAGIITTNDSTSITSRGEKINARKDAGEPQAGMPALQRWQTFRGGHPEPNEESLAAAQACFDLLKRADQERALIVFLISGGGSAMIEWPISEEITLADLRAANGVLISSGASIAEIDAVRRSFSAVKGGRLAERTPNCDQITLIVSDVPRGEEANVASGPTVVRPADAPNSWEVIGRYELRDRLPANILKTIVADSPDPKLDSDSTSLRAHFVLLENQSALEAAAEAARRRGLSADIANDISDQPIAEGCDQLIARLNELTNSLKQSDDSAAAVCLISGGEFACPVRGSGIGGRNLESALRLAIEHDRRATKIETGNFVALCAGSDGIDGNSPAAGAIVDSTAITRARTIGLEPQDFLNRSDAYSFFVALGDVFATGATGTNVRDLRILLQDRSR